MSNVAVVQLDHYQLEVCEDCFDAAWLAGERGYTERMDMLLHEGNDIQAHKCQNEIILSPKDRDDHGPTYVVRCSCKCGQCAECEGTNLNEDRSRCWNCEPETD